MVRNNISDIHSSKIVLVEDNIKKYINFYGTTILSIKKQNTIYQKYIMLKELQKKMNDDIKKIDSTLKTQTSIFSFGNRKP